MLLVIGPCCGLGLVDALELGLVGVTSVYIGFDVYAQF